MTNYFLEKITLEEQHKLPFKLSAFVVCLRRAAPFVFFDYLSVYDFLWRTKRSVSIIFLSFFNFHHPLMLGCLPTGSADKGAG